MACLTLNPLDFLTATQSTLFEPLMHTFSAMSDPSAHEENSPLHASREWDTETRALSEKIASNATTSLSATDIQRCCLLTIHMVAGYPSNLLHGTLQQDCPL
jgi:hypothetical protein